MFKQIKNWFKILFDYPEVDSFGCIEPPEPFPIDPPTIDYPEHSFGVRLTQEQIDQINKQLNGDNDD